MEPLYLIAVLKPRPERRAEARAALQRLIDGSLAEDGCEMYDLVMTDGDPETWVMLEKWTSKAHWDAHMLTEHNAAFGALENDLMSVPNTWKFYTPA